MASTTDNNTHIHTLVQQYLLLLDSSDNRPSSLLECMDDNGLLMPEKYLQYSARESETEDVLLKLRLMLIKRSDHGIRVLKKQCGRTRKHKALVPYYFDDNGKKVLLRPRQTSWYMMYVKSPSLDSDKFNKKFRRRFRMSYHEFQILLEMVKNDALFTRWHQHKRDAYGTRASPIELLLLGALRYLGRGLTFDDLEECTAIHEETHRQFLHRFIEYGSTVLYNEFVKMPSTAEEYQRSRRQYDIGGLTGAGFSTDAINVVMWR